MTLSDWVRCLNALLALITARGMLLSAWRLSAVNPAASVTGRIGVTLFFLWYAERSIEAIIRNTPYMLTSLPSTLALTLSAYGYTVWASQSPRRPWGVGLFVRFFQNRGKDD